VYDQNFDINVELSENRGDMLVLTMTGGGGLHAKHATQHRIWTVHLNT
jgi:hypothetical protein